MTVLSEHRQQVVEARDEIVEKDHQQVNLVKKEEQKIMTRWQSQLQQLRSQAATKEVHHLRAMCHGHRV